MNCSIWYIPDIRPRRADLSESCLKCRTLAFKLDETIFRSKNAPHASIRRSAKSRHRIDFISPSSKKARVKNVRRERQYFQTIAKKYWKVQLNDEESKELSQLVEAVQCHGEDELENIYEEAEKSGTGREKVLREVWKMDHLNFVQDQGKSGNKINWHCSLLVGKYILNNK